jgi:hypothetical protein
MMPHFLQTADWAAFQERSGVQIRSMIVSGTKIYVYEYAIPGGVFWYVPFAALPTDAYLQLAKEAGKQRNVIFLRVESLLPIAIPLGAVQTRHRQPAHSLKLDLTKSSDTLLQEMHQKTRYNIKLAQKKNVRISWEKNADLFISLMKETSARDRFGAHKPNYYKKMIDSPSIDQCTAFFENQPLASALFIHSGATYTYLHGASGNIHREYMAPYLVQWSAIVRAQEKKCTIYDFWGIAPENASPDHPWQGITRFKLGFGGTRTEVGPAFELPVQKIKYYLFSFLKRIFRP